MVYTSICQYIYQDIQIFRSSLCTLQSTLHALHLTIPKAKPPNQTHAVAARLSHCRLHTQHDTLHTLESTLYTSHSALHTTLQFTFCTFFPLHTPHCTLDTLHSALSTPHFTIHSPLHTSHLTLHTFTRHALNSTFHTLRSENSTLHVSSRVTRHKQSSTPRPPTGKQDMIIHHNCVHQPVTFPSWTCLILEKL